MDPEIANREEFAEFIAGKKLPYGALPVAHRYESDCIYTARSGSYSIVLVLIYLNY